MYRRTVGKRVLTFGVSGKLWRNALVMYDRETGTLWSHLAGKAIWGPLEGEMLEMVASVPKIRWRDWQSLHPTSSVLSVSGREYERFDTYRDYHRSGRTGLFEHPNRDRRLKPKDLVIGVLVGDRRKAYPLEEKHWRAKRKGAWKIVQDTIGDVPVVVFHHLDMYATGVYDRRLPNGRTVDFGAQTEGYIATDTTGQTWNLLTGEGPEGLALKPLLHMHVYWFAWSDFYPQTQLYTGE